MNDQSFEWALSALRGLRARMLNGLAMLALIGCGAGSDAAQGQANGDEQIAASEQFVVWLPTSDPLNVEHAAWHSQGACGTGGRRACTNRGEDFLKFHRGFLRRLRQKFQSMGLTHDITPWYRLPAEMRSSTNGWTATNEEAETAVYAHFIERLGRPFASLDEFGLYLEGNLHNSLHGIAQKAYGESAIGPPNTSPTSTYFFKIHGLVEYLSQRFERADWSKDGRADLLRRNWTTGANTLGRMTDTFIGSWGNLPAVGVDGCQWNMAGSADFNFDGARDLIWRGPGCGLTVVWFMNSALQYLGEANLPTGGPEWRIVGTGDFNRDLLPDILWVRDDNLLSFEFMDGPTFIGGVERQQTAGTYVSQVADFDDDGNPDLLIRNLSTLQYSIRYLNGTAFASAAGRRTAVGGFADPFNNVVGTGRYHTSSGGSNADLLWVNDPPCGSCQLGVFVTPFTQASGAGASQSVGSFTRNYTFSSLR